MELNQGVDSDPAGVLEKIEAKLLDLSRLYIQKYSNQTVGLHQNAVESQKKDLFRRIDFAMSEALCLSVEARINSEIQSSVEMILSFKRKDLKNLWVSLEEVWTTAGSKAVYDVQSKVQSLTSENSGLDPAFVDFIRFAAYGATMRAIKRQTENGQLFAVLRTLFDTKFWHDKEGVRRATSAFTEPEKWFEAAFPCIAEVLDELNVPLTLKLPPPARMEGLTQTPIKSEVFKIPSEWRCKLLTDSNKRFLFLRLRKYAGDRLEMEKQKQIQLRNSCDLPVWVLFVLFYLGYDHIFALAMNPMKLYSIAVFCGPLFVLRVASTLGILPPLVSRGLITMITVLSTGVSTGVSFNAISGSIVADVSVPVRDSQGEAEEKEFGRVYDLEQGSQASNAGSELRNRISAV